MGLEGVRRGKITREIYEIRNRRENVEVYSKEERREKLRTKMRRRTIRYEKRLERRGGSRWARKCWEKIKKRGIERGDRYGRNRGKLFMRKEVCQ